MFLRRILIFVLSLLAAHGCAPIPKHEIASQLSSSGCHQIVTQALESGPFSSGEWPSPRWWEDYGDPTLNRLIEQALESSPSLQKAEARLKVAAQVALQRRARLYPEIDFDADDNWQHLSRHGLFREFTPVYPPVINQIDLGLSFSYEFDFWGRNRDLFRAALGKAASLGAEKKQAELILTTGIAYSYFQSQFLLCKLHLLESIETNKEKINSLVGKRQIHALTTSIDRLKAYSMTLDIQEKVLEAEKMLRLEFHRIKALTGLGQDSILEITLKPLLPLAASLPKNLSLDLLARRPDLTAQTLLVEAAAKEIDAAKTDFYPNINLTGVLGLESLVGSKLFRRDSFSSNVEPAFHLPIFTAGRLRARLYEKVASFDEAVYTYNELILQAAQEVADSLTNITFLQQQIAVRKASLDSAQKQADLSGMRFQHAIDDELSFLDAKNIALEAALSLAELEYSRQTAQIQLIRALGGGYHHE